MEPNHPGRPGPFRQHHVIRPGPSTKHQRRRIGFRRWRPHEHRAAPRRSCNRHRGRSPLKVGYYDFDNDGLRWGDRRERVHPGASLRLQQIDVRIYANRNQEYASGGIFNPRTRLYFEGYLTRPISYEFSFQETYDTTNLLDSYVNYRFSNGFQLRFGRYKTPFTYEFYRVHVWHLLAPERSLFATNFEGNRKFGFMGWEAPSATGWNMRSGPLTVSGTRTWSSTAARISWPSSTSNRSTSGRISPAEPAVRRLGRRGD